MYRNSKLFGYKGQDISKVNCDGFNYTKKPTKNVFLISALASKIIKAIYYLHTYIETLSNYHNNVCLFLFSLTHLRG